MEGMAGPYDAMTDKPASAFSIMSLPASQQPAPWLVIPQVERRHRLIEELRVSAPRLVSVTTLAHRLGVSGRTIERDLAELAAAGLPVRAHRGRHGGYQLDVRDDGTPVELTPGEIAGIIVSLVTVGPYSSAMARSALDKLLEAIARPSDPTRAG
jgi:predicted DNA-binding transcriptional regulator YafY